MLPKNKLGRDHASLLAVRAETEKQVAVCHSASECIVARFSITAIPIGEEPDCKGIFEGLFDLAGFDTLQVKVNIQQVKFHEDLEANPAWSGFTNK